MATSTGVSSNRISQVVGYSLNTGNFNPNNPNLPQRIALLGEANTANQSGLSLAPFEILSAKDAGDRYGYGSPIHVMARVLFPVSGGNGVNGIPVVVYPQAEPALATASIIEVGIVGTANANVTHTLIINGRDGIDGDSYDYNVSIGDSPSDVIAKMKDAINAVLGATVIATDPSTELVLTSKWKGATSAEINIRFETNGDAAGLTYSESSNTSGTVEPEIDDALALFANEWNTIVLNSYGINKIVALEAFNGVPSNTSPTGRYVGIVFKPFIALWGSLSDDKSTITSVTDSADRKVNVTNVLCPAPNSEGFTFEAIANAAVLFAVTMQETPHLDVVKMSYPDMPVPADGNIGDFADYNNRDFLVKKGASTVVLENNKYQIKDFVTSYHPSGEAIPQFRYARNLVGLDWNIYYGYMLKEQINVVGHSIAPSDQPISVSNVIKPKQWKQIISGYADDLAERNLIVEPSFMKESITVNSDGTNPDRLNTTFNYKRSPYVRISSTTGKAGFSGALN